jgi:hypothetical protein
MLWIPRGNKRKKPMKRFVILIMCEQRGPFQLLISLLFLTGQTITQETGYRGKGYGSLRVRDDHCSAIGQP